MDRIIELNLSDNYLDQIAEYIFKIGSNNSNDNITIVIDNNKAVEILKQKLLEIAFKNKNLDALVLPSFINSDDIVKYYLFKLNMKVFSLHNHNLLMAQIALKYPDISYLLPDYFDIAKELVELFWKMKKSEISLSEIDRWAEEDLAEHWWFFVNFLKHCFLNYELFIQELKTEKIFLKPDDIVIFCAQTDSFEFLKKIFRSHKKLYVISPKIFLLPQNQSPSFISSYLKYGFNAKSDVAKSNAIDLYEFEDTFEEVNFICNEVLSSNGTISVIVNSNSFEKLLSTALVSRAIVFSSSSGKKYIDFDETRFFLHIAKLRSEQDFLPQFISLLMSNFLYGIKEIQELIDIINSSQHYYSSMLDIIESEKRYNFSPKIIEFLKILHKWINYPTENVTSQIQENYLVFRKINNLMLGTSRKVNAERLKDFIEESISIDPYETKVSSKIYTEYLIKLLSEKYLSPFNRNTKVFILNYQDSLLIDTDNIIFADFNEEKIFKEPKESIWLSSKILKKLDLKDDNELFSKIFYYVYSKALKQQIKITRSKFDRGIILEKCSILDFITHTNNEIKQVSNKTKPSIPKEVKILSKDLPKELYPTNIELLSRNPYGFFVRKILNLRKKKNMLNSVDSAEFGIITHKLIELITKNSIDKTHDDLIEEIFNEKSIPIFYRELWKDRIIKILAKITNLNQKALSSHFQIFSEIRGSITINLVEKDIILSAIADRVEVSEELIRIIDFKTGILPTEKDVNSGKSPQLVILAIILLLGGFNNIIDLRGKKLEILYAKLASKEPYIDFKLIKLDIIDIDSHKKGLIRFLESYYLNSESLISIEELEEFWAPNHDDYKFLRRTINYL